MSSNARSNLEGDAHLRHDYDIAVHLGEEFIRCLIEHWERAVVARHDHVELEEALAGERRGLGAHGVAIADWHEADLRAVEFINQRHVGEDRGITHVINGLALACGDDEPAASAEIDGAAIDDIGSRMPGW